MNFQEAQALLNTATRGELRDHAFGDTEVYWTIGEEEVGGGYFGSGTASVWVDRGETTGFEGEEARELRKCGATVVVERNDETGPDTYAEGVTMPGLTLEGVRNELTQERP